MDDLVMIQVPRKEWKDVLVQCFSTDQDLINKWHVESGTNVETCVNRTLTDLFSCSDLRIYILEQGGKLAGYFGEERLNNMKFMTGFFIKPEFRDRFFITKFWLNVRNVFNHDSFYVGLYTKNKPAISFLKQEGDVIYQDESITTFLIS